MLHSRSTQGLGAMMSIASDRFALVTRCAVNASDRLICAGRRCPPQQTASSAPC
jgi:hypothetical protein